MPKTVLIAANELRRRLRDRSVIVTALVAPLVLGLIMGVAVGGSQDLEIPVAVADLDGSDLSKAFVSDVLGAPELKGTLVVEQVGDEAEARARVDDERASTAIVVPAGFAASLQSSDPLSLTVLSRRNQALAANLAQSIAQGFVGGLNATRLELATARAANVPLGEQSGLEARAGRDAAVLALGQVSAGGAPDNLVGFFGPSMGILFLFLSLGTAARSLIAERRLGTLARLKAAPVSVSTIIGGKALAVFVTGLASLMILWAVTTLAFGASWGDPLAVVALCLAIVACFAGLSALITAVARTEAQADGLTSVLAFTFALVGGNFFPPSELPDVFLTLSRLTPNGWALQALADLGFDQAGLGDIVTPLLVLVAIGVVTTVVARAGLLRLVRG